MDRRAFISTAIGVLAVPLAADAQQAARVTRVGYLGSAAWTPETLHLWEAFVGRLRERGWIEGQNLVFEQRYVEGRTDRAPALAGELVRLNVDVIVAAGTAHARAAREGTTTILIITVVVGDHVGSGLAASLARPGGNVTGMSSMSAGLAAKQLELLRQASPGVSRVTALWNPTVPVYVVAMREADNAARTLAVHLRALEVRQPEDLDRAFAAIARDRPYALLAFDTPEIFTHRRRVADFALMHGLPTMFLWKEYADAGGLYGLRAQSARTVPRGGNLRGQDPSRSEAR